MENLKITVFTSSYNHSKYLRKSIESVLNQTYNNIEYLLFDDGSDDNSYNIMLEYDNDPRVKVIKLDKQANVGVVINRSIRLSTGDYWSWCPADDYWSPNLLEKKIDYINKFPNSVLYNNWFVINNDNVIQEHKPIKLMTSDEFKVEVWKSSPIGFTGILIPMYVFNEYGLLFPEHLSFSEDYYWMVESTINGIPFNLVPDRLHYKRKHENSLTSKNIDKIINQIPIILGDLKQKYNLL